MMTNKLKMNQKLMETKPKFHREHFVAMLKKMGDGHSEKNRLIYQEKLKRTRVTDVIFKNWTKSKKKKQLAYLKTDKRRFKKYARKQESYCVEWSFPYSFLS